MSESLDEKTRIALLERDVEELKKSCVTQQEFSPVRVIVYGLSSAVGATVVAAILRLVVVGA